MKRLIATFSVMLVCVAAVAQEPDFTSTLTSDELRAAGIDGLTPAQVERLNAFVGRYKSAEVKREVVKAVKESRETDKEMSGGKTDVWGAPDEIESRIAGEFNGWRGGTIFRLENGQVWQQANAERYVPLKPVSSPSVTLKRAGFGGYWLKVDGFPRLRVNRVE